MDKTVSIRAVYTASTRLVTDSMEIVCVMADTVRNNNFSVLMDLKK